jgi:hypothetical protein
MVKQNPDEEPASKLLEMIEAGRVKNEVGKIPKG